MTNSTNSITNPNIDKQINPPVNNIISSVSSLPSGSHLTPVYLNFYDLGGCSNTCIHSIGLSFYHCAVQTHSAEYGYMGHPYNFTGLYKTSKHDPRFHLYKLRDSVEIGWTWLNEKEIDKIVDDLKPVYIGLDYHTTRKNSITFAKYLLQQLSNDPQLKHIQSIKIIQFPSYIDRGRRLSQTFEFLQRFDTEKDIAEINILFFLYMKYQGNLKQICQIIKCNTVEKLQRTIQLIEQGIRTNKLPIYSSFATFDIKNAYDYLYMKNSENSPSTNEQLTLTDIFHQFDTVTLRGRTSIDRYLNIQRTPQSQDDHQQQLSQIADQPLSNFHRFVQPQDRSQNQGRTPFTSNISGLETTSRKSSTVLQKPPISIDSSKKFQNLPMSTSIPTETVLHLQETPYHDSPFKDISLTGNNDHNSFLLINNRQEKMISSSRRRKLPRDFELTSDLYRINNANFLQHNYTNNASSSIDQSTINRISFPEEKSNEDTDSNV